MWILETERHAPGSMHDPDQLDLTISLFIFVIVSKLTSTTVHINEGTKGQKTQEEKLNFTTIF